MARTDRTDLRHSSDPEHLALAAASPSPLHTAISRRKGAVRIARLLWEMICPYEIEWQTVRSTLPNER